MEDLTAYFTISDKIINNVIIHWWQNYGYILITNQLQQLRLFDRTECNYVHLIS